MAEQIKGLQIAIGANFSEFRKSLREFDKDLNLTRRHLRATQQALDLEFDADKLRKAQELAQKAIKQTEERAEALRERLKNLEEAGVTDETRREYEQLQVDLQHTENRAKRLQNQLEELNKAKLNHLSKQIKGVGETLEKAAKIMAPISGLAAGVVGGLTAMQKSAMETGAVLDDMTMFMDMSAESYQKLQYVANQTGASMGRVERAFVLLRDTMSKSLIGEFNKSTEALQHLGFTMAEIQTAAPEEMFMEVIKRLAAMEDQTLQVALATQIFNQRVAHDIIPMFRSGADAIDNLIEEFETLGYMTNEQVSSWAALDDQWLRIRTALGAIKDQIASQFLPVWQSVADFVEVKVVPAVRLVLDWLDRLDDGQKKAIVTIASILSALAPLLLIGGKLTKSFSGVIKSFDKFPTLAKKLTGPLGIILSILGLLYTTNEDFRESINNLLQQIIATLMPIITTVGDLFNELIATLQPFIDILVNLLVAVLVPIIDTANVLLKALAPFIPILLELVLPLNSIIGILNYLQPILEIIAYFTSRLTEWVVNLTNSFVSLVVDALEPVVEWLGKVWDWLKRILRLDGEKVNVDVNARTSTATQRTTSGINDAMSQQQAASNFVTQNQQAISNMYNTSYDYSHKNIEVNLTVHNYAEPVDPEWLVEQINIEMAKQF